MSKALGSLDIISCGAEPEIVLTSDERQAFSEAVATGVAQGQVGEVVAGEAVLKWLASWGTDNKLPPPLPGRGLIN